jgi:hypothetical protein
MRPLLLFLLLSAPAAASAQTDTATLNVGFNGLARLSFSTNTLTFPDADPDTVPLVPASGGAITVVAKARATEGALVTLTVQADDDLRSGVSTIPAAMVGWTATGPGFIAGTLSRAAPQTVATWSGSGVRTGTQSFFFRNLWTHPTGTYTVTLLYTLSAA